MTETVTVYADCHAYAWHVHDPAFPETGPDNLTRMAETYGALVEHLATPEAMPDGHAGWFGWADWYKVTGPPANVARLLTVEYCGGDDAMALEMIDAWNAPAT